MDNIQARTDLHCILFYTYHRVLIELVNRRVVEVWRSRVPARIHHIIDVKIDLMQSLAFFFSFPNFLRLQRLLFHPILLLHFTEIHQFSFLTRAIPALTYLTSSFSELCNDNGIQWRSNSIKKSTCFPLTILSA